MRFSPLAAGVLCLCLTSSGVAQSPAGAQQPVVSDYRLGPEDVIQVTVYKECPDFCVDHMVVRPDGKVTVPLIGEVLAAGKTTPQLEKEITGALNECCLDDPRVAVAVKEMNSSKASILGEVKKPDRYKIGPQTTILDVIALAGGFTDFAKKDRVMVRRGSEAPIKIDVEKLIKNTKSTPFYIMPNDTIYVQ